MDNTQRITAGPGIAYWALLYAHSICQCHSRGYHMVSRMEIRTDYVMQFWGDAMLTIWPYGSPGTCIVNCAISQFTDPGQRESM